MDKCRVSDRDAVHLLVAAAEAFGQDSKDFVINRSSIRRCRERLRRERAETIQQQFGSFELQAVVVHWDGKLLPAVTGKETVDRLAVVISSEDTKQMLGVPTLKAGTGREQADAVFQTLVEWDLTEMVKAICFDTTSSNIGRLNGACILLEQLLDRELLYLPCRHHIYELVLKSTFDVKMPGSTGPDVKIFKRFQQSWSQINIKYFKSGFEDAYVSKYLNNSEEVLAFVRSYLENQQQTREDYRKFLELTSVFLGEIPPRGISFRIPGAMHHAR